MCHYQQPDGRQKLVIIGNGMGSVRFLEHLFNGGQCPFHVTVLSEEGCPGYNRIQLSKLLAGSVDLDGIQLKSALLAVVDITGCVSDSAPEPSP